MKPTLVIMVKEPRPGRVKTRLGRDIGLTNSAWWFRHQTRALLRRIEDPRWNTVLAVSPDVEGLTSRIWPAHLPRVAQGRGDLGDRMGRILRECSAGPLCIIGADIPGVTRASIAEAFRALGNHEAVFGPAPDGGYWLIGMKRARPPIASILQNVRWSSEHALADSARSLGGVSIAHVATLQDVDTVEDLLASKR
ncbi:TIGR04282 family arsenosugar biosynthesis glycosyltransferase [Planktotalea sp.]|uniref:TIGR04282 family arsenosugar biosynthesis glycosyltransferase n=1 Tax=Planktotalea sp. TaxID=2029877 RepID=UPI003D6C4F6B